MIKVPIEDGERLVVPGWFVSECKLHLLWSTFWEGLEEEYGPFEVDETGRMVFYDESSGDYYAIKKRGAEG